MSKLFAVFGNPVFHSKSPQLFNSVFEKFQIDAFYTRVRVNECEDIIRTIRSLNIIGANITTPFKECIIPLLDELSPAAEQIGAVNTILNDNGVLKGFNTDCIGVVRSIEEAGIEIFGKRCLVLGAGGASRAAVYGLMDAGAEVFITNRTQSKALEIAHHFGCNVIQLDEIKEISAHFDVIVSTLLPNVSVPDFIWNTGAKVLLDANYRKSNLSEEAQNAGVEVIQGGRWLIHQAIGAFSIFTGFEPPVDLLNSSINHTLDYNQAVIKTLDLSDIVSLNSDKYDLLVSTDGLSSDDVKKIIDEERDKAING